MQAINFQEGVSPLSPPLSECQIPDGSKLFSSARLIIGVAWAQAGRDHMQDSFSVSLNCDEKSNSSSEGSGGGGADIDFFGVFDGHGLNGENIARHVAYNLSDSVLRQYAVGSLTFPQAVQMGFLLLDAQMRQDPDLMTAGGVVLGGTTACAVWVAGKYLYSGNVGDSRLVLCYNGRAFPVTSDHKPANQLEAARIERAGHFVRNARVNGQLAIARAFGDYRFKVRPDLGPHQQSVTALPDVRSVRIDPDLDFLVVATDGVWDSRTNQEVVDFIIERMKAVVPLNEIGRQLIESCKLPVHPVTGFGSDNMTIIIAIIR